MKPIILTARFTSMPTPHTIPAQVATCSCFPEKANPYCGPPMPAHWLPTLSRDPNHLRPLLQLAFNGLVLVSLGRADLQMVWDTINTSQEAFDRQKEKLSDRINTIAVISGLLLTSTIGLLTTDPPQGKLLNYTEWAPYSCFLCSFGLLLGGIVVSSTVTFGLSKCQRGWFCNTLMGSRSRVCCTLILVAYPFFCVGVATSVLATGLLVASLKSTFLLVRVGACILLMIPLSLLPVFLWTQVRFKNSQPSPCLPLHAPSPQQDLTAYEFPRPSLGSFTSNHPTN